MLAKSCRSKVVLKYKYNIQTELIQVFVNFISLVSNAVGRYRLNAIVCTVIVDYLCFIDV